MTLRLLGLAALSLAACTLDTSGSGGGSGGSGDAGSGGAGTADGGISGQTPGDDGGFAGGAGGGAGGGSAGGPGGGAGGDAGGGPAGGPGGGAGGGASGGDTGSGPGGGAGGGTGGGAGGGPGGGAGGGPGPVLALSVEPDAVDFGALPTGCSVGTTIEIRVDGRDACLEPPRLRGRECDAYDVERWDDCLAVDAGDSVTFEVTFEPDTDDERDCRLEVEVEGSDISVEVELTGEGTAGAETRRVPLARPERVDLLVVVDNSGSMGPWHQGLAAGLRNNDLDVAREQSVHVGVVTTDFDDRSQQGQLQGRPRFDDDPNDVAGALEDRLRDEIDNFGSGIEQGIRAAAVATTPPLTNAGATNAGFIRADADLEVVIFSDEEDESDGRVDQWVDRLLGAASHPSRVHVHLMGGPDGESNTLGCETGNGGVERAARYHEAVEATHGSFHDLCEGSLTDKVRSLGPAVFGARRQLLVPEGWDPREMTVSINGRAVGGWRYDERTDSIVLPREAVPVEGAQVELERAAACP